jgi:hypothetical protein
LVPTTGPRHSPPMQRACAVAEKARTPVTDRAATAKKTLRVVITESPVPLQKNQAAEGPSECNLGGTRI